MKMTQKSNLICNRPPKYVYFRKGRWVYYPHTPGEKRREITLRQGRKLLREDTPCSVLWQIHDELIGAASDTLSWLISKYFKSRQFLELTRSTRAGYEIYAKTIENTKLKNGKLFGQVRYAAITPGVITKYLDGREQKIAANREIQFLRSVFSWAFARDICKSNPCKGVRLNPETPRTRLVEPWEYELVYNIALEMDSIMAPAMEIAFLCRARRIEVFNLTRADIKEDGLYIHRTKGSLPEITLWNDRLRQAVELAKNHYRDVLSHYLIHRKDGRAYTKNALDSAWQRLIKKALDNGLKERFRFHDLKAAGVSYHETHHSGHKSEKARAVYLRQTDRVKPTEN